MRPPARKIFQVSELTAAIKGELERTFPDVWVEGEVSDFTAHSSGHWYFSLKDAGARLTCVMFRSSNRVLRFRPEEGESVLCRGRLSVYPARGIYQLYVEHMEPRGLGALFAEFERLKAKLAAEGLFDRRRKRPLPALIRRLAIITSLSGAALYDMLRILREQAPQIEVLIVPAQVQGEGAAASLVRALELANEAAAPSPPSRLPVEAVIIGRGGGSPEDLWAFNEEALARAIAASRMPVIAAVGHEIDYTITDFTADVRAPTPTAAAELVAAPWRRQHQRFEHLALQLQRAAGRALAGAESALAGLTRRLPDLRSRLWDRIVRLDELSVRLERGLRYGLESREHRLTALSRTLFTLDPRTRWRLLRLRLAHLHDRLQSAASADLARRNQTLAGFSQRLSALSPKATLQRGYAIARDLSGRVIRCAEETRPGDELELILGRGRLDVEVERVISKDEFDEA